MKLRFVAVEITFREASYYVSFSSSTNGGWMVCTERWGLPWEFRSPSFSVQRYNNLYIPQCIFRFKFFGPILQTKSRKTIGEFGER